MTVTPRAALCLITALASFGLAQDGPPNPEEIVARVRAERDAVDPALFETLGLRGDAAGFEALKRCVGLLATRRALGAACEAFRHFHAVPGLDKKAAGFLASRARAGDPAVRRAAVRGLTMLGDAGRGELAIIVRRSRFDDARHLALGGLVSALRMRGTLDDLDFLLANFSIPESGPRRLAVGTFRAFTSDEALELYRVRLLDKSFSLDLKLAIIEALVPLEHEGVDAILLEFLAGSAFTGFPNGPRGLDFYALDAALFPPEVVVAAIEGLTARRHRDHGQALERLERSHDADIRRAALVAQGPLQADRHAWVARLFGLAQNSDVALREGAVIALARVRLPAAVQALYHFIRDPAESVRFEAYYAVTALRRRDSIPLLFDRLDEEVDWLEWSPHWSLRMLTGEDHGRSPARWRHWWSDVGATFAMPTHAEALRLERERRDRRRVNDTRASFYGLQITGDRVCFVLDASASMKGETPSGLTRHEAVRRNLIRLLGRLPLGHRFNMIFFAWDRHPWRPRLVPLDEESRASALRFVWRDPIRSGTAIYDALELALEDEGVEVIYLLSDGEPWGGKITSIARIRDVIATRANESGVVIHGIAVGGSRKLLAGLARETGGEYVEVE